MIAVHNSCIRNRRILNMVVSRMLLVIFTNPTTYMPREALAAMLQLMPLLFLYRNTLKQTSTKSGKPPTNGGTPLIAGRMLILVLEVCGLGLLRNASPYRSLLLCTLRIVISGAPLWHVCLACGAHCSDEARRVCYIKFKGGCKAPIDVA